MATVINQHGDKQRRALTLRPRIDNARILTAPTTPVKRKPLIAQDSPPPRVTYTSPALSAAIAGYIGSVIDQPAPV